MRRVVDFCAGPGGWDVAARELGFDPLGVEWDDAACETRRAAGLRTMQADVALVHPSEVVEELGGPVDGVIASPPCPGFSSAGLGEGRKFLGDLAVVARAEASGVWDDVAEVGRKALEAANPRDLLTLEPIRFVKSLRPDWVAFEQVPAVLPVWEAIADGLRASGYSAWTGLLTAERYGVPQTRLRAFLIASRVRQVGEPPATHQRYVAPRRDRADMDHLFGDETPERERIVHPADRHLLPWISMAEALGWPDGPAPAPAPAPTVSGGGTGSGGGVEVFGGKEARARAAAAVMVDTGNTRGGTRREGRVRSLSAPAVTITQRADQLEVRRADWVHERPATTIACDPRVSPPGHHADGGPDGPRQMDNAIRITVDQAAALQSFPARHPWQGSRTKKYEQVGNAVPPLLAGAALREAIG